MFLNVLEPFQATARDEHFYPLCSCTLIKP